MELADSNVIAELTGERSRGPRAAKPLGGFTYRAKRPRCHCGHCERCQDNAKWERIFEEKFADPDYYKLRPKNCGSSLNWVA